MTDHDDNLAVILILPVQLQVIQFEELRLNWLV